MEQHYTMESNTIVFYRYTIGPTSNYINALLACKYVNMTALVSKNSFDENKKPIVTTQCTIDFLPDTVESLEIQDRFSISCEDPIYMPKNLLVLRMCLRIYKQPLDIPKKLKILCIKHTCHTLDQTKHFLPKHLSTFDTPYHCAQIFLSKNLFDLTLFCSPNVSISKKIKRLTIDNGYCIMTIYSKNLVFLKIQYIGNTGSSHIFLLPKTLRALHMVRFGLGNPCLHVLLPKNLQKLNTHCESKIILPESIKCVNIRCVNIMTDNLPNNLSNLHVYFCARFDSKYVSNIPNKVIDRVWSNMIYGNKKF